MDKKKKRFLITDNVKSIRSSKINKDVPRRGELFWVVKCEEKTVRFFESEFKDNDFLKLPKDKSLIGKKVEFECQTFWNHVFSAKIIK